MKVEMGNGKIKDIYLLFETDKKFQGIYHNALIATNSRDNDNVLRRQRHYVMLNLLDNVKSFGPIAEVGCWRGISTYQIASHLSANSEFHIFDSFEGLSEIYLEDRLPDDKRDETALRAAFKCDIELVKKSLKKFSFICIHKGWVPEILEEVKDLTFAFVYIDVDLYKPNLDSLEFFYPRMIQGGIIVLDDYGYLGFPGCKIAVDRYLEKHKDNYFVHLPCGIAFLIKNGSVNGN